MIPAPDLHAEAREEWRPDRDEQMAAIEILLASQIPQELRLALRERELALVTERNCHERAA
jgi:hypothetical protein